MRGKNRLKKRTLESFGEFWDNCELTENIFQKSNKIFNDFQGYQQFQAFGFVHKVKMQTEWAKKNNF